MNLGKPFKSIFKKKNLKKIAIGTAIAASIWSGFALAQGALAASTAGAAAGAAGAGASGTGGAIAAGPGMPGFGTGGLAAAGGGGASTFPFSKTAASVGTSAVANTANRAMAAGAQVPEVAQPAPALGGLGPGVAPAGMNPGVQENAQRIAAAQGLRPDTGLVPEAQGLGQFGGAGAGGGFLQQARGMTPSSGDDSFLLQARGMAQPGEEASGGLGQSITGAAKAGADWFEGLPTIVQLGFLQGAQGLFAPKNAGQREKDFYKWRQNRFRAPQRRR